MNDIKDALDTAFYMGDSLSDAINASSYERMRQEYYKWRDNIVPALSSPHPEGREEDKAQGNNLLSELWKIVEGEAEWREMTLWTPFDPAKKVSGLTRGDLESIFNQYRVFSPVRDFLSRLAAPKPEGQTIEAYQRLANGGPCGLMERPAEEANGCGVVFDWDKCKSCEAYPKSTPAAPEPRPAEEPANLCEGCGLWPCGHHSPIGVRGCITTECANRKPTTGQLVAELRSQLARKDEGIKVRDELLDEIDRGLWDNGLLSTLKEIRNRRAALREPDGRKGECGE